MASDVLIDLDPTPDDHGRRVRARGNDAEVGVQRMEVDPDESQILAAMREMDLEDESVAQEYSCPVPTCRAGVGGSCHKFRSFQALRVHVDSHLLGLQPGKPSDEWMHAKNMVLCGICCRLVSCKCNGVINRTCLARQQAQMRPIQVANGDTSELQEKLDDLPSFDEICKANVYTREFLGRGHLQKAKREYLACIAKVVRHNRSDAWKHVGTVRDSHHHQLKTNEFVRAAVFGRAYMGWVQSG